MTDMYLLSDTTFRQEAMKQLERLLESCESFPVVSAQIYGLRQIARQQPNKVAGFAQHQCERAKRKNYQGKFQAEIDFWNLVDYLCNGPDSVGGWSLGGWSLNEEVQVLLPSQLHQIPEKRDMKTNEDRQRRNQLVQERKAWITQWEKEHIPAFFERFCTQCLYRRALMKKKS